MSTTFSTPLWSFDRSKLFYPLVMNYVVQLFGFKEMGTRGILGQHYTASILEQFRSRTFLGETQLSKDDSLKKLSKLLGPLELACGFQTDRITVDGDQIALEVAQNIYYLADFLLRSSGSLLILAHEICKNEPYHDQGPLWEFLRHCRNAAAHKGLFNLVNGEPRRLAEWKVFRIEASLHGTRLFKDETGNGFLSPGDPIALLWDIEQAYPNTR